MEFSICFIQNSMLMFNQDLEVNDSESTLKFSPGTYSLDQQDVHQQLDASQDQVRVSPTPSNENQKLLIEIQQGSTSSQEDQEGNTRIQQLTAVNTRSCDRDPAALSDDQIEDHMSSGTNQ